MTDEASSRTRPLEDEEKELLRAKTRAALAEARISELRAQSEELQLRGDQIALSQIEEKERERQASNKYQRIFTFDDVVGEKAVKSTIDTLTLWDRVAPPEQEFTFQIYSPGGDVIAGMYLYDFIDGLNKKGRVVNTEAYGYAASMGGILLQAGKKRRMGREAYVLIHQVATAVRGKIGEIEDEVAFMNKISDRVLNIFAKRSEEAGRNGTASYPLSKRQFATRWERKDWWLSSDEALKHGVVDEIL